MFPITNEYGSVKIKIKTALVGTRIIQIQGKLKPGGGTQITVFY